MSEYLNDEQILEKIKSIKVRELVRERFQQKDQRNEYMSKRLNEAANIIGHNTISECMMYE